jgi:hypothetical protein
MIGLSTLFAIMKDFKEVPEPNIYLRCLIMTNEAVFSVCGHLAVFFVVADLVAHPYHLVVLSSYRSRNARFCMMARIRYNSP